MSSRGGAGGRGGRGRGRGGRGGRGRGRGGRGAKFAHIPGADRPQFGNNAAGGGSASLAGSGPAVGGFEFSRVPELYPPLQVDPPPEATADEEELSEIADTFLAEMQQSAYYLQIKRADKAAVPVVARYSSMKKPTAGAGVATLAGEGGEVERPKFSSLGLDLNFFPEELHPTIDPTKRITKRKSTKRSLSMADLVKMGEFGTEDLDGAGDEEGNDDDDDENKIEDDDWEEDDADDDDYNAEKYWNDDDDRGDDDDAGGEAAF